MGFYGNITNTSNTTFQFDRIYPNRLSMDANANNDGIFIGRYVLVEYDQDAEYPIIYTDGIKFYSSPNKEDITQIKFETSDGFFTNEIGQVQDIETDNNGNLIKVNSIKFYQCIGGDSNGYAIFELFTSVNTNNKYIQNFAIDEKRFGNSTFKGYDSTVWIKTTETNADGKLITKYVNIADLNSVVPTFDIAADAPTMVPITPHFDADSTNVYYKLHVQPQWGMRVAAANGSNSDVETYWTRENYNPSTGLSTKQYWNKNSSNWADYTNEEEIKKFDAAIYYNRAGFKEYERNYVDDTKLEDNIINIEPTGESGNLYSNHNQSNSKSTAKDIQEIRINLPAIGNMMSDAWDIIHGPNRDDARTDEKSSLQGRLDSFEAFYDNQIPVKQVRGTIIGSKINNAEKYDDWEGKPQDILDDKTNPNFERDDAWIKTEVSTTNLMNGDKNSINDQKNNSGIAIHHTFHKTKDSTTQLDKNTGEAQQDSDYKSQHISAIRDEKGNIISSSINSKNGNKDDYIKLYTPYIDAMGHVVGKNIETIKLPYGYKTITTNGRGNDTDDANDGEQSLQASVVADSTQDSLALNSGNKWIRIDTDANNDEVVFSHDVHNISKTNNTTTDLNNSTKYNDMTDGNTVIIPDWDFDNAGHITEKHNRIYTLPFGYKTITIANDGNTVAAAPGNATGTQTADNTQDDIKFNTSNKWIVLDKTDEDDVVKFGHLVNSTPYFEGTYRANTNGVEKNIIETEGQKPKFGKPFNILNVSVDRAGHVIDFGTNTVTIPEGKYEKDIPNTPSNSLIVGMELDGATGEITTTSATTKTLKLTDYSLPTSVDNNGILTSNQSINEAFGRLEYRINKEVKDREAAINALDVTDTVDNTKYVSGVSETNGKITVSRAGTDTLKLSNYSMASRGEDIDNGDTLNVAFGKLQKQIKNIYNNDEIAENFDSIKEISEWLKANDSNADKIIDSIATLKGGETQDGSVAKSIKDAINNLNSSESVSDGSKNYLTGITIENGIITGKTEGVLGSAAFTETSAYVDATTYAAKITELEDRIKELEDKLNPESEALVEGE